MKNCEYKSLRYSLGLDLGIGSIGWAIVELDKKDAPKRLIDLGVRVFNIAEIPKTGDSLNKSRREARLLRRRLKRKRERLKQIQKWLITSGYLTSKEDLKLTLNEDVWKLRVEALDRKLTNLEFAKVILHIAKYRGFLSNRKAEINLDVELGKNNKVMLSVQNKIIDSGVRTYAELLKMSYRKHNTNGVIQFLATRNLIIEELKKILYAQYSYGDKRITDEAVHFLSDTIYKNAIPSEDNIDKMIGHCTFFNGKFGKELEKRAPKDSFSFEYFSFIQKLNNIKTVSKDTGLVLGAITISDKQRSTLLDLALSKNNVTFSDIRKMLEIDNSLTFTQIPSINSTKKAKDIWKKYYKLVKENPAQNEEYKMEAMQAIEEAKLSQEKDTNFFSFKGYHKLKKVLKTFPEWEKFKNDKDFVDTIYFATTRFKTDDQLKKFFRDSKYNLSDEIIETLPNSEKFGHLSVKALKLFIPFLEKGYTYDKAVEKSGLGSDKIGNYDYMPIIEQDTIRNPVVLRAVTQNRKLIKAIVNKYGHPTYIHLELAREMGKSREDRQFMMRRMEENHERNINIDTILKPEFGLSSPSKKDRIIYNLWTEQNYTCLYSLEPIAASELFHEKSVEIDHIIPLSKSMDDSYHNKVLVKASENQRKGRRTPIEYLGDEEKIHKFLTYIKTLSLSNGKIARLKLERLADYEKTEFSNRALNDTRYITKFIKEYLEKHMKFADENVKVPIRVFNGQFTEFIRKSLGIAKKREATNRHHALDAVVLASATTSLRLKVENYFKQKEEYKKDTNIPSPWINFRDDIIARTYEDNIYKYYTERPELLNLYKDIVQTINPVFVSRMPSRNVTGKAHDATITSGKEFNKGKVIKRESITKINKDKIKKIVNQDRELIKQLISQLDQYENKPDKAFANGFKYKKTNGEEVTIYKLKIYDDSKSGVDVRKGKAGNGTMTRIDIFRDEKKYYVVPVYSYQIASKKIPNKAIVGGKPEKEWTDISEKDFVFSVYPGELLAIVDNKGNSIEGYYLKTNRSNATMIINGHDAPKQDEKDTLRYKIVSYAGMKEITKYYVDYLGNKRPIKNEKRML